MLNKIFNRIKNPQLIVLDIFNKFSKYLTDEQFLRYRFRIVMGKRLDLKIPLHIMRNYSGLNYMIEIHYIQNL